MDDQDPVARRRWTVGGCLVVTFVILVGAGLILPILQIDSHNHKESRIWQCGKNQSQILGAMVAYATSEETSWPDPRGKMAAWKLPAGPIATASDGAKYTAGAFELLAVSQSIPGSLFKCPSTSSGGPSKVTKPTLSRATVEWGWNPAGGVAVSYGFDWASPPDPSADRVVLADREVNAHRGYVMVTFGDAHVTKVKLVEIPRRSTGILITESVVASPLNTATGVQPGDDIYSNEGDPGDPLTPGAGDPLRAWVK